MTEKKIRATLGDSVIVGIQTGAARSDYSGPYIDIKPSDVASEITIWLNDGWKLEYIQGLPTLPGAIVRGSDGTLYVRHYDKVSGDSHYMWINLDDASGMTWGDVTVAEGGFEVLFEGVPQ